MRGWKGTEIKFAKALDMERQEREDYSLSIPDMYNDFFVLESKNRKQGFPKLIENAFKQVREYNDRLFALSGIRRTELVGLHRWGSREDYFITIRLSDFAEILKKAGYVK